MESERFLHNLVHCPVLAGTVLLLAATMLLFSPAHSWGIPGSAFHGDGRISIGKEASVELSDFRYASNGRKGKGRGFESLSPEEKSRLKKKYEEWQSLPPEEKERLRRRMNQWQRMPRQDRELYERRYRQWQKLSPAERGKLREKFEQWDDLSPEEREKIRKRFRKEGR